jgi:phage-related protein
MVDAPSSKTLVWLGSSRKDFREFPDDAKSEMGYALFVAQCGGRHRKAKALSGFGGAGVVEIVVYHRGDAFRTVYAVRFASAIYVLHAFQKKSKKGVATPQADIRVIEQRLREAERLHQGG